MIGKIKAAMKVMQAGEAVSDPAKWKTRAVKTDAVAFVSSVITALAVFGFVDIQASENDIEQIVEALLVIIPPVGILFSTIMHIVTTTKIGLRNKSKP